MKALLIGGPFDHQVKEIRESQEHELLRLVPKEEYANRFYGPDEHSCPEVKRHNYRPYSMNSFLGELPLLPFIHDSVSHKDVFQKLLDHYAQGEL